MRFLQGFTARGGLELTRSESHELDLHCRPARRSRSFIMQLECKPTILSSLRTRKSLFTRSWMQRCRLASPLRASSARLVLVAVLALQLACSIGPISVHATRDDDIPAKNRAEVAALDARIDTAIVEGNAASILALVPENYRAKWGGEAMVGALLRSIKEQTPEYVATPWHTVKAEFGGALGQIRAVPPDDFADPKAFFLHLEPFRRETFVSLRTVSTPPNQGLIATIYARENDGLHLYGIRVGLLRVLGRDAMDWIEEAGRLRETSGPVAASIRAALARQLLRPVPFMQFVNEPRTQKRLEDLAAELQAQYSLPMAVPGPEPQPSLYSYSPVVTGEGLSVAVHYITTVSLEQGSRIEAEARAMHPKVLEMLPGLCDGVESIVYRAFKEPPSDPQRVYERYGTVVRCGA